MYVKFWPDWLSIVYSFLKYIQASFIPVWRDGEDCKDPYWDSDMTRRRKWISHPWAEFVEKRRTISFTKCTSLLELLINEISRFPSEPNGGSQF